MENAMNDTVKIRFYEELNDFLPPDRRKRDFDVSLDEQRSVKVVIEKLGVPSAGVDLVLVNGEPVSFCHRLKAGDRISVYPEFEAFDISEISKIRWKPLRNSKFLLPGSMKKLGEKLKTLGFDTKMLSFGDDHEMIAISKAEKRIIVTMDESLADSPEAERVIILKERDIFRQVNEIMARLQM